MKTSIVILSLLVSTGLFAQRGKDNSKTISATTMVNDYTTLSGNASAGATTINVASSTLNGSGYFSGNLAPGDLIFIIQMQGATITSPNNDATDGAISTYNNCGNNEFAEVSSVPSATSITLDCGLKNDYTGTGKVQIIRVPRYTDLTINNGGILTSPAWNGSTGGVLAVEVLGITTINTGGKIDQSGKGFRGGALDNTSQFGTGDYTWNTLASGAEKGESVAGSATDYDGIKGRYDRGANANGGGGGNGHNSGGGGGANAGDITLWNGQGNPDVSTANMILAWNLESPPLASSTSSGGGRGGYSYGPNNGDPTVTAPGNGSWGGDFRRQVGGLGGRPLDYTTGRLFLGGGGGAGDQNESKGTAGTNGGGMVYLVTYSDINGSGSIISNGIDVANTGAQASDGSGGAGAGGTVILNAQGTVSGITINANGGKGGTQVIYNFISYRYEAEGPGGGGGGGYIAIRNGTPVRTANGGLNGTTNSGAISAKFPSNGATIGAAGLPNQGINGFFLQVTGVDTICSGTTTTLTVSAGGTPPAGITYYWYSTETGGSPLFTGNTFTTPTLTTPTTYYAASCPGTYRIPVQVSIVTASASFSTSAICLGIPMNFTSTASSTGGSIQTYSWDFGDSNTSTGTNPSHTYASANTYTVTLKATDSLGCSATYSSVVTVNSKAQAAFSANVTSGCAPLAVTFTNSSTNGNSYNWSFGDAGTSSSVSPLHNYSSPGTYTVTLYATINGGCNDTLVKTNYIVVSPPTSAAFSASNVCFLDTVVFNNTSTGATGYTWKFGDSNASGSANPTHNYASPGTYTVWLIASNGSCQDSTSHLVVVSPGPSANFSALPLSACDSLNVQFTNTSSGGSSYSWDFGDTYTSGAINPSHNYTVPGTYSVKLTAIAGNCSSIKTLSNIITIFPTPHATVSVPKNLVCLNNCTDFTSITTGSPTSWSWSFTGASITTSTDTNPTNVCYYNTGSYNVALTVSNANCTSSQTLNNYIYVDECTPPHASFTSNDTTLCGPGCVNFTSTASNIKTYEWHFPGATPDSSAIANPTNICYSSNGTYTVQMIVTNNFTADTLNMPGFIHVVTAPSAPTFTQTGDSLTSSTAVSYQWYLNGTLISGATNKTYKPTQFGNYSVTTTDANGCTATSTTTFINVGIEEYSNNDLLSIYPNPFDGTLNLLMKNDFTGNASLKITDAIGKLVFEKELKVATQPYVLSFDVSDIASGVYIVTLESEKFNVVRKVVKQ